MKTYYFDYNATTPVLPQVIEAMAPFWREHFANASSAHHMGREPQKALREARREVAALIHATKDEEIVFTSGGSEANNLAIRAALKLHSGKKEIVTTAVEHSSVLKLLQILEENEGYTVKKMGVDENGALKAEELRTLISDQTALVSVMMANNETGVIYPIDLLAKIAREKNVCFHVDAVQAAGKIPIDVQATPVDFLTLSAHKFYGPKGAGALYVNSTRKVEPLIVGGTQERGRRAGTENIPAIVGMGVAAKWVRENREKEMRKVQDLRDDFEAQIQGDIADVIINSRFEKRLPNTSHIRMKGIEAETVLMRLDQKGICVSQGSACMSGAGEPSHVLKAMGLSDQDALSALRISFGIDSDAASVNYLFKELDQVVTELRALTA